MSDNNHHRDNNLNPHGSHFYQSSHHQDTQGYGQQPHPGYGQHNDQRGNGQYQYVQQQRNQQHQNKEGYGHHQLPPPPPPLQAYGGLDQQHIHPPKKTKAHPFCEDYLLDQCKLGTKCHLAHPPALDVKKKEVDFKFDTSVGVGYERCVKLLLPCSIVAGEHTGGDNPCDECYHFGGNDSTACLPSTISYNDSAWEKMFSSKWSLPGFERAAKRARGEEEGKIPAAPMPFARVRPGWTGKTKDQVVAKLDFIPEEVRKNPRPYLEVPRKYETGAMAERRAKKAQNRAIYAPGAAPAPARPQLPRSGLSMPLPPPLMEESFGRPTVTVTDHINGFVEYKYENGSYRESLSQQSNAGLGVMAATRPIATPTRKRSAPADEAESGSSATMPPPPALGAKR